MEIGEETRKLEACLMNPAFRRFARQFEVYQAELQSCKDEDPKQTIKDRMHRLYPEYDLDLRAEGATDPGLDILLDTIFAWCEIEHSFGPKKLAEKLIEMGYDENFTSPVSDLTKPDEAVGGDKFSLNNVVSYTLHSNETASLHLGSVPLKGRNNIVSIILDGFQKFATLLQTDSKLSGINTIALQSWILGQVHQPLLDNFFGQGQDYKIIESPELHIGGRDIGLMHNDELLTEYLRNGVLPEVRQLNLTRTEFINKFSPT